MPFADDILNHRSVSIVGMAKNSGKTETLNYILWRLKDRAEEIAVTSIGVDGEKSDIVTATSKPEVTIYKGMTFVTTEKFFRQKRPVSEIFDISESGTTAGRLISARAVYSGKAILSGPPYTAGIRELLENLQKRGVGTTIVDGALSRLSLASPAVTEAMILTTGAVVSANMKQLIKKTLFLKQLIDIEAAEPELVEKLQKFTSGVWAVNNNGEIRDLEIGSALLLKKSKKDIFKYGNRIYVAGAVTDLLLDYLRMQNRETELIVRDFSTIFTTPDRWNLFLRSGNRVSCIFKTNLVAVTINPTAPTGFRFDSKTLKEEMQNALGIPVYDVVKLRKCG